MYQSRLTSITVHCSTTIASYTVVGPTSPEALWKIKTLSTVEEDAEDKEKRIGKGLYEFKVFRYTRT